MPRYREDIFHEIKQYHARIHELEGNTFEMINSPPNPSFRVAAEKLKPEMFFQVFKYLKPASLKNCREVCSTWRNTITDNTELMKSLTFNVNNENAKMFMESQLATKVKSIRIQEPLQGSVEFLKDFFKKIGATVEEIVIDFESCILFDDQERLERIQREKLMFSMMLRLSTRLNSIIITSKYSSTHYNYLQNICKDVKIKMALCKIRSLSITVNASNLATVEQLVLHLPNLRYLDFNCVEFGYEDEEFSQELIQNIILDHLRKFNGKLQEISLENTGDIRSKIITKLLLYLGKKYPKISMKCKTNLNDLLSLEESEQDIQINQNTCRAIKAGILKFSEAERENMNTTKIQCCTNLVSLDLEIDHAVTQMIPSAKLGFIKDLTKLKYLRIKDFGQKLEVENGIRLRITSSVMLSLNILEFDGEGLGLNSILFNLHFPNLTKLFIRNFSGSLNADFIYGLTNLVQLECLTLENLEELTDQHLISKYDFVRDEKDTRLPAIAGFKNLKHLHIVECCKLTDSTLKRGFEVCSDLEKLTLCYYNGLRGMLTTTGFNSWLELGIFKMKDLPCCHAKKHADDSYNTNSSWTRYTGHKYMHFGQFKRFFK